MADNDASALSMFGYADANQQRASKERQKQKETGTQYVFFPFNWIRNYFIALITQMCRLTHSHIVAHEAITLNFKVCLKKNYSDKTLLYNVPLIYFHFCIQTLIILHFGKKKQKTL